MNAAEGATTGVIPPDEAGRVAEARVGWRHKLAFGIGGITDMVGFHGPVTLVNPIFNITLGLSPTLIGLAKAICRVWDAVTDPAMGTISDRSTSRHGRRRPFIVIGALAMGITFFALFVVPRGLGSGALFAYLTAMLLLFYSAFTVFTVPYHALGYELATSYDDRTRVMAWRLAFNMVGNTIVSWLFTATQLPIFDNTMEGVYYVGAATGVLIVACGIIPGLLVPEKRPLAPRPRPPVGVELKAAFGNRPFLRLVGLALLFLTAATASGMLADYVNFYYVYEGDLRSAAVVSSSGVTIGYVMTLLSVFAWTWLGARFDKKTVLLFTLLLNGVFSVSTWWLFTPAHPYWQVGYRVLTQPLLLGFWLMLQSMIADTCEYEELTTGGRRDALLGAFVSFSQKVGVSAAFIFAGLLLDLSGFRADHGGVQDERTLLALRAALVAVPVACMVLAVVLARGYPLSRARMAQISRELAERRQTAAVETGAKIRPIE